MSGRLQSRRRIIRRAYDRLSSLACCSETEVGLTRTFASPAMQQAAKMLAGWMEEAGLVVGEDPWFNVFGRTRVADRPLMVLGSHYDTVRNAGIFDGALGILAGLAALECLEADGRAGLPFAVEIACFSEEEGVRFRRPYLGSRAACGRVAPEDLACFDAGGSVLAEVVGAGAASLPPRFTRENVLAYLEIHIEQGPVLEQNGAPLGVVTTIAGQSRFRIQFLGVAGHAGTCPMSGRHDALAGAASWILAVEEAGGGAPGLVATVGCLEIPDAATNVIPGRVILGLDVRHPVDAVRRRAVDGLRATAERLVAGRGLQLLWEETMDQPAVVLDKSLRHRLVRAVSSGDCPQMVSGAGHDAVVFAGLVPTGLMFVRCRSGISHHPDEHVSPDDFEAAVHTLVRFLQNETL